MSNYVLLAHRFKFTLTEFASCLHSQFFFFFFCILFGSFLNAALTFSKLHTLESWVAFVNNALCHISDFLIPSLWTIHSISNPAFPLCAFTISRLMQPSIFRFFFLIISEYYFLHTICAGMAALFLLHHIPILLHHTASFCFSVVDHSHYT